MTSITAERNGLAAVGMTLRRREQWGARRSYTDARAVTEPATRVFVHITITNPENYSSRDAHARAVEAIGISRFPNTGISYNRMIFAGTDTVYEAQPIGRRGAHTVNDHQRSTCTRWGSACPGYKASLTAPDWNLNYNARAYVICQNTQHTVTDQMVTAIARAIAADARAGFVTEYAALRPHGHRCVSSKSCPGDKMWAKMGSLKTKIAAFLANPATIGSGGSGGVTIPPPPTGGVFDPEEIVALTAEDKEWFRYTMRVILDEKVFDNVWNTDEVPAPSGYDTSVNPNWTAANVVRSAQAYARLAANKDVDVKAMAAALAPLLPAADSPTAEELEAALRNVFGSLDDAPA